MKRSDLIRINFIRNWNLPGKERLSRWFGPSAEIKSALKNGIIWLREENIALFTTADNYIEWTILNTGTYEDEIGKLINISLRDGENALDIGANIGLQSLRMSKRVGQTGKVYSFEPLVHIQKKFKQNITLNKADNVRLFEFALSDRDAAIVYRLDVNTWNQGTFSLQEKAGGNDEQRVDIKIGDELKEIQQLNTLALIKIDVEGFEFNVLRGLKSTLEKHRPRIIFEYDLNYWTSPEQNIKACFEFLSSMQYNLYQINAAGAELIKDATEIDSGNLFCVPAKTIS